jgi:hypothetical protein
MPARAIVTNRYFTLSLQAKLLLAAVSASTDWILNVLADWSNAVGELLSKGDALFHVTGIVFGALVMAPYVTSANRRVLRVVAMCIASAAIYYGAVRFVVDGPFGNSTLVPFLISGGGAGLLVGLTIVLLGPRRLRWILIPSTLVAGAIGGVAFDGGFDSSSEAGQFAGFAAWQVLVCLALHFSFKQAPT